MLWRFSSAKQYFLKFGSIIRLQNVDPCAEISSQHGTLLIAISFQFEGLPIYPDVSRMWNIIDKYKVTKFYTAPTAIRLLMKYGDEPVKK